MSKQVGIFEQVEVLFEATDDDRARSVLTTLKSALEVVIEKRRRAEDKLTTLINEERDAMVALENFIALDFGHAHEATESPEPVPAGVDPITGECVGTERTGEALDPIPFEPEDDDDEPRPDDADVTLGDYATAEDEGLTPDDIADGLFESEEMYEPRL